jgi:hypothetical protein
MSKMLKGQPAAPKIMDASEYAQLKEKQREYRQRIHPDVNYTYKDVMCEGANAIEVDSRFYKKNLDYATFSKGFEPMKQQFTRKVENFAPESLPTQSNQPQTGGNNGGQLHQQKPECRITCNYQIHRSLSFRK